MLQDMKEIPRREVLATIVGLVLIVTSMGFAFLDILPPWIMFILVALGLGIVFPKRLAEAAKAIANLSPLKK